MFISFVLLAKEIRDAVSKTIFPEVMSSIEDDRCPSSSEEPKSLPNQCTLSYCIFDPKLNSAAIEVFHLNRKFHEDKAEKKVNLTIGAYRTARLKPYTMPIVKEAEHEVINNDQYDHEYLPIAGMPKFCELVSKLILGEKSSALEEKKIVCVQTLSGTGALRLGNEYLSNVVNHKIGYVSNLTWGSHKPLLISSGFTTVGEYRYFDRVTMGVDIQGMLTDLEEIRDESVIVLHACAHNPTGADLTKEEWMKVEEVMRRKKHVPFFDLAYQGFATGDVEEDAWAIRYFVEKGHKLLVAQSCAKNFGLYNERIGSLILVHNDPSMSTAIKGQLSMISRYIWSSPPAFGARLVSSILEDPKLNAKWQEDLKSMFNRLHNMRIELRHALEKAQTPGDWSYITKGTGMFTMLPFTQDQIVYLRNRYSIYMMVSGRVSLCGLNQENIDYVAHAICETIRETLAGAGLLAVGAASNSRIHCQSPFAKASVGV